MSRSFLPTGAEPCLWMTAGLLAYRLCDRDFECEGCPLDAALRGGGDPSISDAVTSSATLGAPPYSAIFPADRRYTAGHLWLWGGAGESAEDGAGETGAEPGRARLGVDGLAAALLGSRGMLRGVLSLTDGASMAFGRPCCELDLGFGRLSLAAPVSGRVLASNAALARSPELLTAHPYDDGWVLELEPEPGPVPADDTLFDAGPARARARLDLRRFRRQVAFHLLLQEPPRPADGGAEPRVGPTLADGGAPLTDLRQILGDGRWLTVLRELIH